MRKAPALQPGDISEPDFSRYVEKVILMVSQALISPLAIFINSELLRIGLWKKPRFLGALGLPVKSQISEQDELLKKLRIAT